MPKKKRPEEKPEEQFKRFKAAAKTAEVDTNEAERAFRNISDPAKKTQVVDGKRSS